MTYDEFRDKAKELVAEFVVTNKKKFDVFVNVINTENGDAESFGYGCAACAAEIISADLANGEYEHNDKDREVVIEKPTVTH